jgi:hypothetical protein
VTAYRFLDAMGDAAAIAWARDEDAHDHEVFRVEYRGPEGDWRWAGAL